LVPDQVRDDKAGGCHVFAVVPWNPASAGMTMEDGEAGRCFSRKDAKTPTN